MASRFFKTIIGKIPIGGIDFTEMYFDFLVSDNIDFETVSTVSDISSKMLGVVVSVGSSMVPSTDGGMIVVPQSKAVQFSIPSNSVVQGIVAFDKNDNLLSFIDFGSLREFKANDVFTLDLPTELFKFRGRVG